MSLLERFFPIVRRNANFFDPWRNYMENDFLALERQMLTLQEHFEKQMEQMRKQMFQLLPWESESQALSEIKPSYPIVSENGETKLKLDFNVKGFKPEEVQVKVIDKNVLEVQAKSEEKSDKGESHRFYVRHYVLPKGVEADKIKPSLSKDGVLTIEAPAPNLKPEEKIIPIKQA